MIDIEQKLTDQFEVFVSRVEHYRADEFAQFDREENRDCEGGGVLAGDDHDLIKTHSDEVHERV